MEPINTEVQHFIAASEYLLASTIHPEELTQMEQDIIRYYLSAPGEKFSSSLTKST